MIFGTFCTVMTFHIFFTYPETVRKSLEEVDEVFDSATPVWKNTKTGTFEDKVKEVQRTGGIATKEGFEHQELV